MMRHSFSFKFSTRRLLLMALVLMLTGGAGADIIPEGHRKIGTTVLVEGTERFPEMTFAIFPAQRMSDGNRGERLEAAEVKGGKGLRFGKWMSPKLYALKAGWDLADVSVFEDPSVPRSSVRISEPPGTLPRSETAKSVRRIYRITGISGNEITLEQQPDQYFDASGTLLQKEPSHDEDWGILMKRSADHAPDSRGETIRDLETRVWLYLLAGSFGLVVLGVSLNFWMKRRCRSQGSDGPEVDAD